MLLYGLQNCTDIKPLCQQQNTRQKEILSFYINTRNLHKKRFVTLNYIQIQMGPGTQTAQ